MLAEYAAEHLAKFGHISSYAFPDYPEQESDEFHNRYFKNPTVLEIGAVYIGEWYAFPLFRASFGRSFLSHPPSSI